MDIGNIGQRISQLRKQSNMSQKKLAEKLNISNKTASKWECGNGMPDIQSLGRLADVFGITLDELVHFKAEPSPSVNQTRISSTVRAISISLGRIRRTFGILCFLSAWSLARG